MSEERKEGFYWCKVKPDPLGQDWIVAEYYGDGLWGRPCVIGMWEEKDCGFLFIGTKIENPNVVNPFTWDRDKQTKLLTVSKPTNQD